MSTLPPTSKAAPAASTATAGSTSRQHPALVYYDASTNRLVVRPPTGQWTVDVAKANVAEFARLLGDKKVHFVGDCRYMDGYETATRDLWQHELLRAQKQIVSYTFVGVKSTLIRLGISTMSLFVKQGMTVVETLDGLR